MKILIVGFAKIKYMPYLNLYLENIDTNLNDVSVLCWNRDGGTDTELPDKIKQYVFSELLQDESPKISKIGCFLKFRRFAENILRKENFDFVIVLTSIPAVLLSKNLTKKYKGKYIYDYRDYTYEKFPYYKKIVGDLVKDSYTTFVSSDGFRVCLPEKFKNKIFTTHNFLSDSVEYSDGAEKNSQPYKKIRISFWGIIRHQKVNLEIMKKLANDRRFELHYYGREQKTVEILKKYKKEKNIENVFFHGEYEPYQRFDFIKQTDIIHNIYCDENSNMLMSNKYYDGIIFKIPQICMTDSFMGQKVQSVGVGKALDPYSDSFVEDLYEYYQNLNAEEFKRNCEAETEKVLEETKLVTAIIRGLTKGKVN